MLDSFPVMSDMRQAVLFACIGDINKIGHLAGKLISVLFFCRRSARPYDPAHKYVARRVLHLEQP